MAAVALPTSAQLNHLRDDPVYHDEVPYEIWADNFPEDTPRTNVRLNLVPGCPLTDVRSIADESQRPTLATAGFEWMHQKFPRETGLWGADDVNTATPAQRQALDRYLVTMAAFLQERLGCAKAVCWDWRVRRSKGTLPRSVPNIYSLQGAAKDGEDLRSNKINSSHVIHADGSPAWMQKVVAKVATRDEAAWATAGRYRTRVLTVWRPLVDVVEMDPLVCCDTRTVADNDLDIVQKIMDDTVEESMYLKWRDQHQWYWMSNQTRDEVLVMTVWDSKRPTSRSGEFFSSFLFFLFFFFFLNLMSPSLRCFDR